MWLQSQATVIHPPPMVLISNATKRRSKSSFLSFATSYLSGETDGEGIGVGEKEEEEGIKNGRRREKKTRRNRKRRRS